eukprot:c33406_g1_i1 orf=118-426(+)
MASQAVVPSGAGGAPSNQSPSPSQTILSALKRVYTRALHYLKQLYECVGKCMPSKEDMKHIADAFKKAVFSFLSSLMPLLNRLLSKISGRSLPGADRHPPPQ